MSSTGTWDSSIGLCFRKNSLNFQDWLWTKLKLNQLFSLWSSWVSLPNTSSYWHILPGIDELNTVDIFLKTYFLHLINCIVRYMYIDISAYSVYLHIYTTINHVKQLYIYTHTYVLYLCCNFKQWVCIYLVFLFYMFKYQCIYKFCLHVHVEQNSKYE